MSHPDPHGVPSGIYDSEPGSLYDTAPQLDAIVDVALTMFADNGFEATKLETIAKETGVSKRMLNYHFDDKRGLYKRALIKAAASIAPPQDFLDRSYAVPVEGIRRFVDAIFYVVQSRPEIVKLILRENLDPVLDPEESHKLLSKSEVILQIERLLLLGQDVGAFRPGISAADLLTLVSSISFFRASNAKTVLYFGNLNLHDPRNTEGMRRLAIDAALTFLTSNIPPSGYDSYLVGGEISAPDEESTSLIDDIYLDENPGENPGETPAD